MKDEDQPYIDDADYDQFVEKTVQASTWDYFRKNILWILGLIAAFICVAMLLMYRNPTPLIVFITLIFVWNFVLGSI